MKMFKMGLTYTNNSGHTPWDMLNNRVYSENPFDFNRKEFVPLLDELKPPQKQILREKKTMTKSKKPKKVRKS